eukprot:6777421-Prymnesium_polylepis.1
MRIAPAHAGLTLLASHSRSILWVSCACAAEAETPVPIAQTGSYAMTMRAGSSDAMHGFSWSA